MIGRTSAEVTALATVGGAIMGYFPHIAAAFGALYWIAMFVIKLPELKEAIQKLRKKKKEGA